MRLETAGSVPAWIYDCGTLALLAANDAAVSASGYGRDELLGLTLDRLVPDAAAGAPAQELVLACIRRRDGTLAAAEPCASVALDADGPATRLALFRLLIDPVTGLPSRGALLNLARGEGTSALLLVRIVWTARSTQRSEDAHHRAARAAAQAIAALLPRDALLVRYAESTFAIRLPGGRARAALGVAKRVLAAFERPLPAGEEEISGTPSIGIAAGGRDAAAQIGNAEAALEHAAETGTGLELFVPEIARQHDRHASIERNLRHAVLDGRVNLVYQPIVSLRSAEVVGAEALMRWDCPGLGTVPPDEFIVVAEESRAILRLGEWVLREACAQNRRWQLAGLAPIRMTVNVSAHQIEHSDFIRTVKAILESTSLAAEHLELELTGPAMTSRDNLSRRTCAALRRLGVRIAIDEFGASYSSLRDIGALPIDTLKLARPFVGELGRDPFANEAVSAAVRLAHLRGIRVVAVGVEDAERVQTLRTLNCDEAQGFLLGAPVAVATFTARLEQDRLRPAGTSGASGS
jgi:EAL domain-containing protein (putative c-di-GMP-specific phosphodiesterase class I)/GGDEF domain-containing protein